MAYSWEDTLRKWKNPPSENEKSKRDRTERQIRDAHTASNSSDLSSASVYSKGSYANNTNVRLDYDVDIAVECKEFFYSDLVENVAGFKTNSAGIGIPVGNRIFEEECRYVGCLILVPQ